MYQFYPDLSECKSEERFINEVLNQKPGYGSVVRIVPRSDIEKAGRFLWRID